MTRAPQVQAFLNALDLCIAHSPTSLPDTAGFMALWRSRLASPGRPSPQTHGHKVEACAHLAPALSALESQPPPIRRLGQAFAALELRLTWAKRAYDGPCADRFAHGHGNAEIIGPGGLEDCASIVIGVTVMAPGVDYPEHSHPPDELYIALSEGEWRRGQRAWFSPGVGGLVRNTPGVSHAMRSTDAPLLAIWSLIA
ncbi:MAG TPA: dimethylsulfonioproprionate lyase family protein [Caulobacteraceae bacterium]